MSTCIQQPWEAQEEDTHPSSDQFNLVSVLTPGVVRMSFSSGQDWSRFFVAEQNWNLHFFPYPQRFVLSCQFLPPGSSSVAIVLCCGMQVSAAQRIPERILSSAHAAKSTSWLPWLKACVWVCCHLTLDSLWTFSIFGHVFQLHCTFNPALR